MKLQRVESLPMQINLHHTGTGPQVAEILVVEAILEVIGHLEECDVQSKFHKFVMTCAHPAGSNFFMTRSIAAKLLISGLEYPLHADAQSEQFASTAWLVLLTRLDCCSDA
jgi:hypothetical protein